MKVILYMAISANGIIARNNNEEDFLSHTNWDTLVQLADKTKCLIWGRKTYDNVMTWGAKYQSDLKDITKVVISTNSTFNVGPGYDVVSSPQHALDLLVRRDFTEVILAGGSKINSMFAEERLVDEVIFNIDSVVIGNGIPVFSPANFDLQLELISLDQVNKNILQLHYKVKK